MPKFRITYQIDASDYHNAESIALCNSVEGKGFTAISKVCNPKPRHKWFVYVNGVLDLNSLGGLTKTKAKTWVKQYRKSLSKTNKYCISDTLRK